MNRLLRVFLQAINYAAFLLIVWYFSSNPAYRQLDEGQAVLTLAFAHAGELKQPCRQFTPEELSQMAPNMRRPLDCPRERSPVTLELQLDEELIKDETIEPLGLHKDQGIDVFYRLKIPSGRHRLQIRMNDDVKVNGPTYEYSRIIILKDRQHLVVEFDKQHGGFLVN